MKRANISKEMRDRWLARLNKSGGENANLMNHDVTDEEIDAVLTDALREDLGLSWPAPASSVKTEQPFDEATIKQWEQELGTYLRKKHGPPL